MLDDADLSLGRRMGLGRRRGSGNDIAGIDNVFFTLVLHRCQNGKDDRSYDSEDQDDIHNHDQMLFHADLLCVMAKAKVTLSVILLYHNNRFWQKSQICTNIILI